MTTVHPKTPQVFTTSAAEADDEYQPDQNDALTVLFFGCDDVGSAAGTYVLARFDPVRNAVSVAVLPPQTVIVANGREETLIDAYSYGGARYTKDALSAYLGFAIDRYVRMDIAGFVSAASVIGGVEFELEDRFELTDSDSTITFNTGLQLLDGKHVAAMIRNRDYSGGELERCQIAAQLVCAIVDQRIDIADSVLVDKVFETVINLIETDISYTDYEQRKSPAKHMAQSQGQIAVAVLIDGEISGDGQRLILNDTTLAALNRRFV